MKTPTETGWYWVRTRHEEPWGQRVARWTGVRFVDERKQGVPVESWRGLLVPRCSARVVCLCGEGRFEAAESLTDSVALITSSDELDQAMVGMADELVVAGSLMEGDEQLIALAESLDKSVRYL